MCRRKTGTWSVKTQVFVREDNPKTGDINYGMIAHGRDIVINRDTHDAITRSCYCHHEVLSMHLSEVLDGRRLMEHLSANIGILTLAGVSLGSGVLHQEVKWTYKKQYLIRKYFVKNSGLRS